MPRLVASLLAVALLSAGAASADADAYKGKGKHGRKEDHSSHYDRHESQNRRGNNTNIVIYQYDRAPVYNRHPGQGFGVGQIPPGHRGYYKPGQRLRPDQQYIVLRDYDLYRLPPPRPGESYVRIDNNVLRILRDTSTVIEAMGIIGNALN